MPAPAGQTTVSNKANPAVNYSIKTHVDFIQFLLVPNKYFCKNGSKVNSMIRIIASGKAIQRELQPVNLFPDNRNYIFT